MGLARCAYEMKCYEKAIAASDWAIEMNRGFPGVHKYKALAEKARGDLDAAIATMNRAVLYETPWDDDNRRRALVMYDELIVESKQKKEES
jgi:tetratricopeptide (TPR) repeat protein